MMRSCSKSPEDHFDFAIVGAGLSGLMLVMALLENEKTSGSRILLLDRSLDDYAPRTWCFWEKEEGRFEDLVEKKWQAADFFSEQEQLRIDLRPYAYKMISGQRFRDKACATIRRHPNVRWVQEMVEGLHPMSELVSISTATEHFTASLVFDSRWQLAALERETGPVLYQQFEGWFIRSQQPVFDAVAARLMDFRMEQKDAVAFCYLLPMDERTALVEYTLFTGSIRPQESLEAAVADYLGRQFPGAGIQVRSKEKGIIPMCDLSITNEGPRVIPIGTAGGCTKPSSGYTFMFVQEHTEQMIAALNKGEWPKDFPHSLPARRGFYDRVLLRILEKYPDKGAGIFFSLFKNNPAVTVLDFMRNASTLQEEMAIFRRLPLFLFLKEAFREMRASVRHRKEIETVV
ncbi:lycopene cyclase family protein [Flavitalea sp. BT771]|uniref:lycopene cyclase family protein n=1 Tax=Flavitalea sp. BT771 TaxID=3063329 RepID=UPI0026E27A59|nr:lycopene cyclase family protein [Flavitalea sp. BT771]MDO6432820.1 lycopene cyclase family protein [Flavitalea sp. BT771]MDV6221904.1 lycopene cyclase family protein [Flavitalea sp. BT771]